MQTIIDLIKHIAQAILDFFKSKEEEVEVPPVNQDPIEIADIDFDIANPDHKSPISLTITPETQHNYEYKCIKNAGRIFIKSGVNMKYIYFQNVYNVQFDNVDTITLDHTGIRESAKGYDFRKGANNIVIKNWYSHGASDPANNDNGDGVIVELGCHKIEFIGGDTTGNRDAGMDIKGDDCLVMNHNTSDNAKGFKLWGFNNKFVNCYIHNNRDYGIFQINGDSEFDSGCRLENNGKYNIRTGLTYFENNEKSKDWTKKVVYRGAIDDKSKITQGTNSTINWGQ